KSLRLSTAVLNNDLRHPVVVAHEAATVDLLTDGRLQLGLGAGWAQSEYDQAGLSFDAGATRVERLAEAVAIIKGLLEGEKVTFAGRHYRVTGHAIYPLPVQRPRPPILIGGNARRLLVLAAREADVVGLTGITFQRGGAQPDVATFRAAAVDERVEIIRKAAGERYDRLELSALVQRDAGRGRASSARPGSSRARGARRAAPRSPSRSPHRLAARRRARGSRRPTA